MRYSPKQYAEALHELAVETPVAKRRGMIRDFLAALARQSALGILPEIERAYEEQSQEARGVRAVAISAPERISESGLARRIQFKSHIDSRRDVRLRGGAVIETGGVRIDNSLARRLARMREALAQ